MSITPWKRYMRIVTMSSIKWMDLAIFHKKRHISIYIYTNIKIVKARRNIQPLKIFPATKIGRQRPEWYTVPKSRLKSPAEIVEEANRAPSYIRKPSKSPLWNAHTNRSIRVTSIYRPIHDIRENNILPTPRQIWTNPRQRLTLEPKFSNFSMKI